MAVSWNVSAERAWQEKGVLSPGGCTVECFAVSDLAYSRLRHNKGRGKWADRNDKEKATLKIEAFSTDIRMENINLDPSKMGYQRLKKVKASKVYSHYDR